MSRKECLVKSRAKGCWARCPSAFEAALSWTWFWLAFCFFLFMGAVAFRLVQFLPIGGLHTGDDVSGCDFHHSFKYFFASSLFAQAMYFLSWHVWTRGKFNPKQLRGFTVWTTIFGLLTLFMVINGIFLAAWAAKSMPDHQVPNTAQNTLHKVNSSSRSHPAGQNVVITNQDSGTREKRSALTDAPQPPEDVLEQPKDGPQSQKDVHHSPTTSESSPGTGCNLYKKTLLSLFILFLFVEGAAACGFLVVMVLAFRKVCQNRGQSKGVPASLGTKFEPLQNSGSSARVQVNIYVGPKKNEDSSQSKKLMLESGTV